MELSIIIVNWKSSALLVDCLHSIYAKPPSISFEIIVIDNASFDGCDAILAENFQDVRFIQSKVNLGFSGANNSAFLQSTGETVCFLNPDTIVCDNALQKLFDALHSLPDAGAAGALLRNTDKTMQTSCILPFPTIFNQSLDTEMLRTMLPHSSLFGMKALYSHDNTPKQVEALSGACIMVSRAVFTQVGMFSADYFMYAEDIDLCTKIRNSDRCVYFIKSAEIIHIGGGSSKEQKNRLFAALVMRESNYRLVKKFKGPLYAQFFKYAISASALIRISIMAGLLLPAMITGRTSKIREAIDRWWHIVRWTIGKEKWILELYNKAIAS
jgi:GT2 family glycosyltransferase